jgi:hypothetical protein
VLVSEQPILFEIGSIVAIPSKKHPAVFKTRDNSGFILPIQKTLTKRS